MAYVRQFKWSLLEVQNSSRAGKLHPRDSLVVFFRIIPKQIGRFSRERPYARSMIGDGMVKVFRYSFSEAIPIFFNRLKGGFFFVRSL